MSGLMPYLRDAPNRVEEKWLYRRELCVGAAHPSRQQTPGLPLPKAQRPCCPMAGWIGRCGLMRWAPSLHNLQAPDARAAECPLELLGVTSHPRLHQVPTPLAAQPLELLVVTSHPWLHQVPTTLTAQQPKKRAAMKAAPAWLAQLPKGWAGHLRRLEQWAATAVRRAPSSRLDRAELTAPESGSALRGRATPARRVAHRRLPIGRWHLGRRWVCLALVPSRRYRTRERASPRLEAPLALQAAASVPRDCRGTEPATAWKQRPLDRWRGVGRAWPRARAAGGRRARRHAPARARAAGTARAGRGAAAARARSLRSSRDPPLSPSLPPRPREGHYVVPVLHVKKV
eukprot:scaffold98016_cov32-Tisochrysis_lutea.AAC.2